jgi:predicted nuclease of predicted toxin-antitoxin system
MNFWVDAQLSPHFAPWLSARFSVPAFSVRDLGLRDARAATRSLRLLICRELANDAVIVPAENAS